MKDAASVSLDEILAEEIKDPEFTRAYEKADIPV